MANKLYEESHVQDIANAIREQNGTTETYNVSEMGNAIRSITTGIEPVEHSWNQIPTLVKNYLDNVTYDPSDYTVSSIADYAPATADVNNTYPIGKSIESVAGILDRNGYEVSVSDGNTIVYNDIPNQYTEYTVRNNGVISKTGTLRPTGFLRQIKCATTNVRDLGGWSCDGGTVKYGKLFRGGEFKQADLDIFLNQLKIKHELNLRGLSESNEEITILRNYVRFTCPDAYVWYTIGDTYKNTWKEILGCVFDAAINNEPVFFHCSAGADRTGTVACIIEAILGVSQSDIDKDYELTCFKTGTATDNSSRRRNETEWSGLITQINNLSVGNSFRDKVLNWVASLGFTVEEINSFRNAMIDGTPDTITLDIDSYTVTNTLTNVTSDNETETIAQYQPYEANITVPDGYVINDVTITMGGTDVTSSVFKGTKTFFKYNVTNNISNCTTNNTKHKVISGEGYGAKITAQSGYTLEGATVSITMGGIDVSNYYSDGVIAIPNVTGDLVINIQAVQASQYVNKMVVQESNLNKRISGTAIEGTTSNGAGSFICDPIAVDITTECPVIFKNFGSTMGATANSNAAYSNSKVALLNSSKNCLAVWYIAVSNTSNAWYCPVNGDDCVGDLSTILDNSPSAGTIPSASDVKYVIFAPCINDQLEDITMDDLTSLEIQMLE